jgi:hypothetical protein
MLLSTLIKHLVMDFNLLLSLILYTLIGVSLLLIFRTILVTKYNTKVSQEIFFSLEEKLVSEKMKQERAISKNTYLENYNISLFNNLFEITKELLLTKKIIFEEHYN